MRYGICKEVLAPMRSEPFESREMISQMLYGQLFEIVEEIPKWIRIRLLDDKYEGWCDCKTITEIDKGLFSQLKEGNKYVVKEPFWYHNSHLLAAGSTLFEVDAEYPELKKQEERGRGEDIALLANRFLNAPYLWGGKSIFGIDCSGLTQICYYVHGFKLLRDASLQVNQGRTVSFLSEAKEGDLAFFDNAEGQIIHVGIISSLSKIIHASGRVRIDKIDHQGIYNEELQKYTHKLRVIKRII